MKRTSLCARHVLICLSVCVWLFIFHAVALFIYSNLGTNTRFTNNRIRPRRQPKRCCVFVVCVCCFSSSCRIRENSVASSSNKTVRTLISFRKFTIEGTSVLDTQRCVRNDRRWVERYINRQMLVCFLSVWQQISFLSCVFVCVPNWTTAGRHSDFPLRSKTVSA